ncbi:MAG: hypothetical protein L0216_02835 [Planctomycetales bacterium]|nr:hypothetical protein [Planctomycetales bacterium]
MTGKATGLARAARKALRALEKARVPYSVVGAAALASRGFPRMTRDLDVVVLAERQQEALAALHGAGFKPLTPTGTGEEPESMVLLEDPGTGVELDLLAAAGDPEARIIAESPRARIFGTTARVATLEHLLLMYLYSTEPKHLGDFATVARSGRADLAHARSVLAEMHPEMLGDWDRRVADARAPRPAPKRPPRRRADPDD